MDDNSTGSPPVQTPVPASVQRRAPLRWYISGALVLIVAGAGAGGWAMTEYMGWRSETAARQQLAVGRAAVDQRAIDLAPVAAVSAAPAPPTNAAALASRVAVIEARMAQMSVAADSMTGNAARAEALLIAFAARRALDRGLALGNLESQLRLRFGDGQPNAVRTVIDAARMPVTLDRLQTEFERLTPELTGKSGAQSGIWAGVRREVGELLVIRRVDAPSTRVDQRLARAQRLLDAGLVDAAAREVAALPGAPAAASWLVEARQYHEARRALDLIETAAILAPRETAPGGAANMVAPAAAVARR